jgi:anti-sigma-K factor RskA
VSADIHSLAGAYALDALDDVERAQFERHLAACPSCRAEVDGLLATTARLAAMAEEPPPPWLRDRVLGEVDVTRQRAPSNGREPPSQSKRGLRRLVAPVAAAAAAVAVTLAVVVLLPRGEPTLDDVSAVMAAPDAEIIALETTGEFTGRVLASDTVGQAVIALSGLDEREDGRLYVLWAFRDGTPINERSLTAAASGPTTIMMVDDLATVTQVAMTVESDGEVSAPTGPVVASAELRPT